MVALGFLEFLNRDGVAQNSYISSSLHGKVFSQKTNWRKLKGSRGNSGENVKRRSG